MSCDIASSILRESLRLLFFFGTDSILSIWLTHPRARHVFANTRQYVLAVARVLDGRRAEWQR